MSIIPSGNIRNLWFSVSEGIEMGIGAKKNQFRF